MSRHSLRVLSRQIKTYAGMQRNLLAARLKQLSNAERLLPDFLIIGTQRAGTTSLFRDLISSPLIHGPRQKEVNFFDINFSKGINWYKCHFEKKSARDEALSQGKPFVTFEATPYYLFHPLAPMRVHNVIPDVKLVALLRNPVDRAFSNYHHSVREGREHLTFEEAIKTEETRLNGEVEKIIADGTYRSFSHENHSYVSRSFYDEQLERWFRYFAREKFLILKSEDFYENPAKTIKDIFNFLNLSVSQLPSFRKENSGRYSSLKGSTRKELERIFRPHNERLSRMVGISW